jgi:DNA-binding MarR family transcriptional regulator
MKQHLQLPSTEEKSELTPKDKLIYLALKSFDNPKEGCFPSIAKISERCGASAPTISKSLELLEKEKYIEIIKVNQRKRKYKFSPYKKFECFSYDFLYNKDLTFIEKSYLAASQQYMLEKETGRGKIEYSSYELSEKINMPPSTIRKCDKSLVEKQYMTIVKEVKENLQLNKDVKYYNFVKYNEAVCDAIISHENRITDNTERISNLEKENKELKDYILKIEKELYNKQTKEKEIVI